MFADDEDFLPPSQMKMKPPPPNNRPKRSLSLSAGANLKLLRSFLSPGVPLTQANPVYSFVGAGQQRQSLPGSGPSGTSANNHFALSQPSTSGSSSSASGTSANNHFAFTQPSTSGSSRSATQQSQQDTTSVSLPPGFACSVCLERPFEVRLRCSHVFCERCVLI